MMAGRYDGKVVWITGASAGIGRECAREFAREGAKLVLSARRRERLDELVEEFTAAGTEALAAPCDVTDEASVQGAVDAAVERFGQLDVALANAGYGVVGSFDKVTFEDWRRQMDVNVLGVVATVKAALPELHKSGGRVALVASVASFVFAPNNAPYNASKAAVRAIGETLSAELVGSGVSCTTIHPGFVASEIALIDSKGVLHDDWKDKRPSKLMWKTEDAARVMVRAIHRRKREFVFTHHGKLGVFLARHTPGVMAYALGKGAGG